MVLTTLHNSMGPRRLRRWATGLAVLLCAAGALAGPKQGLEHYCRHEFDEAIAACQTGKDLMSRLVLGLSHAEKYALYRNKTDKVQASMFLKILKVDATVDDAPVIEKFLAVGGNPVGNKEAAKLLKEAFKTATTPKHVLVMAGFLDPAKGIDVNKIALAGIQKRLKPVRTYIGKGGSIPAADRALFQDRRLLERLVGCLDRKKTASAARKCLVYIEEPVLPYLEGKAMGKEHGKALLAVKKAIAKRVKKYPDSAWFSAYGR